ncbi:disks large homolog 5-like isoform X2 [Ruditapes philippinarum]|uniref:disks large homolog 5-like isoform X2 n=1 Tax=Ruditapes philippinarum TaxID=129788 RepID=UPI00295B8BFF|nr:disks large homolog 5-like isoform X2 [Ruditapes philippinarum]
MEDKFKELLEAHRSKFSAVVDADGLLLILERAETLTQIDVDEINKQTSNKDKIDKILDILTTKDNFAFKSLCYALEQTYPHLLTVMFLGNSQRIGSEPRPVSVASDSEDDVLRRSNSTGDARSQDLKTYTRIIPSYEYDDFQDLDPSLSEGHRSGAKHKHHSGRYKLGLNGENRQSGHNRDYDWLKSQCERAMSELQALKSQQTDNTKRYEAVMNESDSYRQSYVSTLNQLQQSREEVSEIRGQNHDLIAENKRLEQEVKNFKKLREEDQQEMAELRKRQRDIVSQNGSSEVLNALDMYDRIKQEYDSLRESYSDLVTQRSALVTKYESGQEEITQLKKQYQSVCSERDAAVHEKNGLKQQCTAAIRNWDQVLHERNDLNEKIIKITQQMNQALASQLHLKKELEIVQKDRDAILREYTLVMSEREQVHKDIEQLQETLSDGTKKIDALMKEKKVAQDEAETLKREISSALQDRDRAVKERNEFNEKCNELMSKHCAIEKQREDYKKNYENSIEQRDIARKERQEAMQDRDRILREKYEREQFQKEKAEIMDQVNKETEHLKKQVEKLQQELYDCMHEAEIAKSRRDWAMSERDKIVQERDSVRTLCDNLRRDRDRAVSKHAQALRDYDEIKKQKQEALRELKETKEKYELVNDKESRKSQLNSVGHNRSRDSAIDADLQEFETETIDVELTGMNKDDLGFDLVGGKDDPQYPNDNSIFVSHVTKGSLAEGKLKMNDQILRINNKDVTNVDKRYAVGLLRNRSGIATVLLRRRKISPSTSRSWQSIQFSIPPGKDIGIHLENGLYVTRVNPGSYSAKEGLITVGDRIMSVNGRSVENMSPEDLQKVLYQCGGETIMLDVWRQTTPLSSAGSSPVPIVANVQEQLLSSPLKSDSSKRWESTSESSKGSIKNIKSSGSQTDSLDSPGMPRRPKDRKHSDKDLDNKGRHSVHILETVNKFFRPRHKSSERTDNEKGTLTLSRPQTMIEDSSGLVEFSFPTHRRDNSGSSNTNRSSGRSRDYDREISGTGTWPNRIKISNTANSNGTVIQIQKNHPKRPTIDAVINHSGENIPTARVPPLPPERNNSSFVATRHTPQNSDSTITHSSHPPSPSLSPQPSTSSTSSYFPKSPTPRSSFNIHEPSDSQSSLSQAVFSHFQGQGHSQNQTHSQSQQGHLNHRSTKVNNTRNPPRMPHIPSQVATGQFNLEFKSSNPGRRRPLSGQPHESRNTCTYLSPASHQPPRMEYGQFGSRSNNTTPEPLKPPPPCLTDRPPGGRPHPTPSSLPLSLPGEKPLPVASQPVVAKPYTNVHQATKSIHMPPFITPLPGATFPDSMQELDHLPPYNGSTSEWSSPSPSQFSAIESSFTPTPSEHYPNHGFPGSSPVGPGIDSDFHLHNRGYHNKFRIPSTPSMTTNDTSGSVEVVSDRSSPGSPFHDFSIPKMLPITSPHADSIPYRKKPKSGETRKISIEKTSKLVGFQIEMGPSGGIFVSSVNENSLAAQAGLVIGDQLLEICAINMRNATYDLAARVLQQCGNNLTMLVQFNPEKYNDNDSGSSAASSTNTSPLNSPDAKSGKSRVFNGISQRETPKSPSRVHSHSSSMGKYDAQRKVSFKKPNPSASLGISLTGGNATGIFVHNIEEGSPAAGHNGVHQGDQILEYNGIDFTRATAEQAYRHLNEPCSSVRFRVRYHPSLYNKVRNKKSVDSIYVRAMIDHNAEKDKEGDLSFRKDDLLHIEDTMHKGQKGVWYAWIISDYGEKIKGGTIPSKDRLEDNLSLHRSLSDNLSVHDSEEYKTPARRGSGSARRSFFRKSKKHQRTGSKDSREFNSFSDVSLNSDSLPVLDDVSMYTYLSVEKLEYKKTRPVVLIAPLADALIQKLSSESPDKYYYCEPSVIQTSHHCMEQGLKEGQFIDYWQQDERYLCIRLKYVTDICDKNIHCLLNVNPLAIERLQRQQIYPIVVYARHKSYKQLREIKDVQFLPEKLGLKSAKELFEYCQKAEQDYRHLISATIQGGNLAEMAQQIKNVISSEQEKPIWVPSSILR